MLLQDGAPITYVSRQLGHKDPSITLRVYAHWLPDDSREKLVNLLDDTHLDASQAHPRMGRDEDEIAISAYGRMASLTFASWNQIAIWLRRLEALRQELRRCQPVSVTQS